MRSELSAIELGFAGFYRLLAGWLHNVLRGRMVVVGQAYYSNEC